MCIVFFYIIIVELTKVVRESKREAKEERDGGDVSAVDDFNGDLSEIDSILASADSAYAEIPGDLKRREKPTTSNTAAATTTTTTKSASQQQSEGNGGETAYGNFPSGLKKKDSTTAANSSAIKTTAVRELFFGNAS